MDEVLQRIRANSFAENDLAITEFVARVKEQGLSDADTAALARAMGESGAFISLAQEVTDVPSTGGPGSLTTLVAPIAIALAGGKVLKVSVPGRPAGALDTLETLPGYRSELSPHEVSELSKRSPYVHVRAGAYFAPADAKIFAIRKNLEAVSRQELIIASLLAKKLCVSCRAFALDVRVGQNGNAARTIEEGILFSKRFVQIAQLLQIRARCVITDSRRGLPSPYLGRGESLRGLGHYLTGKIGSAQEEELSRFAVEALSVAKVANAGHQVNTSGQSDPIRQVSSLLEVHGARAGSLEERLDELEGFAEIPIISVRSGWIAGLDLRRLKLLVLELYTVAHPQPVTPVWEVGLFWEKPLGQVAPGDRLCLVRVKQSIRAKFQPLVEKIQEEVNACLHITKSGSNMDLESSRLLVAVVDENCNLRETG